MVRSRSSRDISSARSIGSTGLRRYPSNPDYEDARASFCRSVTSWQMPTTRRSPAVGIMSFPRFLIHGRESSARRNL